MRFPGDASVVPRTMISFGGVIALLVLTSPPAFSKDNAVSFNRDVLPILSANCFACHGPDEETREADLRLDQRTAAIDHEAIVPTKPDDSELIARIESNDADLKMPPPETNHKLSSEEIKTLRLWIQGGANYETHWAFRKPTRPNLPAVRNTAWPKNEIDHFVLARIENAGLTPSAKADRYTLARRVYLDLIGLPPTPEEADAFVNDTSDDAYRKLVDRLLDSPQYGERWARRWLDLARYADTNGYEKDRPRSIWPYRDWVIRAINDDMPYDQFTIEQLAGDMLPDATQSQKVATGFHRNTMLNEEGGIDPLEYRFYAMVDRVATTGTVWLGLTTGCAQCHSHKYDPISHTDYFRLMALLNNADEPDLALKTSDIIAKREAIVERISKLEADLPRKFPLDKPDVGGEQESSVEEQRAANLNAEMNKWIQSQSPVNWRVWKPSQASSNLPKLETLSDGSVLSTGDITKRDVFKLTLPVTKTQLPITAIRLEALPDERLPANGPGRAFYEGRKGDFFLSEVTAKQGDRSLSFLDGSISYGKISVGSGKAAAKNVFDGEGSTGWSTSGKEGQRHVLVLNLKEPISAAGDVEIQMVFERHFAASLGRFRLSTTSDDGEVKANALPVKTESLLLKPRDQWSREEESHIRSYFLQTTPLLAEARKPIDQLQKSLPAMPITMVMQERAGDNPRKTYRHHRGEFLSAKEQVTPGVPSVFSEAAKGGPENRLEFARWLVSENNPMAARVFVNRTWEAFFGVGLVRSNGDFGTQSEPPTHPELLDWLAIHLSEQNWSRKELHRLIVTSATYRQQSNFRPELQKADPQYRLFARGPRFRVEAEMVRDVLLKASGLLSNKMYGPSVYPPQPASVTALAYGNTRWPVSKGADRYRRSLYTFTKRTAPFAAYTVFDGPTGENCVASRSRSNTPLQALTLLNDELFLEMSRHLGKTAYDSHANDVRAAVTMIVRRCLTRSPAESELKTIESFYNRQLAALKKDPKRVGQITAMAKSTPEEAALMMVARAVMNLDETISKQ